MKIVTMKPSVATAIAGAMAIGFATASWAAPVLSNSAALIGGLPTTATYVDDRGGSRGSGTNTRLLEDLALGAYGAPASPSTTTPSNDVTARPNSSYGSTQVSDNDQTRTKITSRCLLLCANLSVVTAVLFTEEPTDTV